MRRWKSALLPVLTGTGWLLILFSRLLSPGLALANRDIPVFHLPLRAAFRDLARYGLPQWNPWIHAGQPILSNPSYGAFYPPSWLVFLAPPYYAMNLMVLLHAAVAFAGAWRLARHFGCNRATAALAGVGYAGCGSFLSLLSAFTLFGSMAWFPWVLTWGDQALRTPPGGRWWRPALLAGGALGLQLLNGEPSTVVVSGLGLLALAVSAAGRRPRSGLRVLLPVAFAVALAAVQLVPTLGRIADTPRKGLSQEIATIWSMPPQRLVEIAFPRFFGDPALNGMGLFIGWKLNDRDYPYVETLYPGLLLTVMGLSALLLWPIPRRAGWALGVLAGLFLALGRHNPLFGALRDAIPILSVLRFPEKFILLSVFSLAIAGFLGWQRMLDERDAGRLKAVDFPLALALVVLGTAVTLAGLLLWEPRAAAWFVYLHGHPDMTPLARGQVVLYLQIQSWLAVLTSASVAGLLALCRWRRPRRRLLEGLALFLLAADLWHYGSGLLRMIDARYYVEPSPLAKALLPVRDRVFHELPQEDEAEVVWTGGDPQAWVSRTYVSGLEPYSGTLWGIPYAFNVDFDFMLTTWARRAEAILATELGRRQQLRAQRFLGAWNVGTVLQPLKTKELIEVEKNPKALPRKKIANPSVLPRFRFVPKVAFFPKYETALAAASATDWRLARADFAVRPGRPPSALSFTRPPRLLGVEDQGSKILTRYRSEEGAFLVIATTFDKDWRARVDGRPVTLYPTAACQIGVELPPGGHQLVLEYRDPRVGFGAAVTFVALLGGLVLFFAGRRRGHRALAQDPAP